MNIRKHPIEEMQDRYDAEKRLLGALPGQVFSSHLEEAIFHFERLEHALQVPGVNAAPGACNAMQCWVGEGQAAAAENKPDELQDSATILRRAES